MFIRVLLSRVLDLVPVISASNRCLLDMTVNTTDDGLCIETPSSSVLENTGIIYDTGTGSTGTHIVIYC